MGASLGIDAVDVKIYEAGGLSSDHDLEIFRAWQKAMPGYEWVYAKLDRYEGLTLFDTSHGMTIGLHFAHALCGYGGTGPHTTVQILVGAGFGHQERLEAQVFSEQQLTLTK
ncbi:MAG: hypothetical protein ACREGE_02330 [Candidatus Microsaccharimonas sp.]